MGVGFDWANEEVAVYWRTADGKWEEFYRMPIGEYEFRPFDPEGIDETKPNHVYMRARNGRDTIGLWSYDMKNKRFDEVLYARSDVDVWDVRFHSNGWGASEQNRWRRLRHGQNACRVVRRRGGRHQQPVGRRDSVRAQRPCVESVPGWPHAGVLQQRATGPWYLLPPAGRQIGSDRQPAAALWKATRWRMWSTTPTRRGMASRSPPM